MGCYSEGVRRPRVLAMLACGVALLSCRGLGSGAERLPAGRWVVFHGACDASGSVPVDARHFVVADDEDNTLRVFDAEAGGPPLAAADVSSRISLAPKAKKPKRPKKPHKTRQPKKAKAREADLEAATRLGDLAIWMSSHGRSKSGKREPDRLRYFVTELPDGEQQIEVVGDVYRGLLDDLVRAPQLARFGLDEASRRPPQEAGGLNIEGMTASPDERFVWIGFRNPIPEGRALLVPLLNPTSLSTTTPAQLGAPVQLDLRGRGVRALSWWRGRYLILGGAIDGARDTRLYAWTSTASPPVALPIELGDFNAEAIFSPEDRDEIMLLSDEGDGEIDGQRCKDLRDPSARRFRGVWVRP